MAVEALEGLFSTMLASASYDPDSGELAVQMHNGREYTATISPDDWKEFQAAPSKGSWYRKNVMGLAR